MDLRIKEGAEPVCSPEFWYDLFDGGYIDPEDYLVPEDAEKVRNAMIVVQNFVNTLENEGLFEEM